MCPTGLFSNLDTERLATWLDGLVSTARPLMKKAQLEAGSYVTRLVRRVAAQVLEADPAMRPERVWTWLGWLDGRCGHNDDTNKRLGAVFHENRTLRASLLEHLLLTPRAENIFIIGRGLSEIGLELHPTGYDLAGLLQTLRERAGDGRIDIDSWRDLLLLGRTSDGLPEVLRNSAVEVANGNTELLSILDEMSEPVAAEWEARRLEREAENNARQQSVYRAHRQILAENDQKVAAGDFHVLADSAAVYLGRSYALAPQLHLDSEATPKERLSEFLGDELADRVMSGFVATLDRDDLPSASRIAEARCENKYCVAEASMICGIAEMLHRGHAIHGIEHAKLAATYMAWQRGTESDSAVLDPVGLALEAALFQSDSDWEVHFRTSIEPQLDHNRNHPSELYELTHEVRFSALAGRLSVDWLRRYTALNLHAQTELLTCALKNAPHEEIRELVIDIRDRAHPDHATELLWLSADYVIDLEARRAALETAAAEHPDFIWIVRDRIAPENGHRFDRFSLDHLVYIVEAFGMSWPNVQIPSGGTTADCNPADASEFIRRAIYAVARLPSPETTEALQRLIDGHAPTYVDTAKHALALQQRVRSDHEYSSPSIGELRAVVENGLPENIDDMRDWFEDRLEALQERLRGSDTDMWEAYWNGSQPRRENFCRNRMIEHIAGPLPESIRFAPETHMPAGTRADIALTRNQMKLPVEIKCQWHRDVWNAASHQLDAKYAVDWQAEGRGVYIVLWFGNVPKKQLPKHPDNLTRPGTPEMLKQMLIDRLPQSCRSSINVFVIDVSKPEAA